MDLNQKTLTKPFTLNGKGLHSGKNATLNILPSEPNTGIAFQRVDIEGEPIIKASISNVISTQRGTTIQKEDINIATIEHLLSALWGTGIDNAIIQIDGSEVPILDGSSQPFVDKILDAGVTIQDVPREFIEISEPVVFRDEDNNIELIAIPDDDFKLNVLIDYDSSYLANHK